MDTAAVIATALAGVATFPTLNITRTGTGYALAAVSGSLAADTLRHRLVLSYEALAEGLTPDALIARVMSRLPLPDKPMQHNAS